MLLDRLFVDTFFFFYTFPRISRWYFLGRKARSAPVIKVRQTCSIILIHGRSRGSFSTSYLSRVPRDSFEGTAGWYTTVLFSPCSFTLKQEDNNERIHLFTYAPPKQSKPFASFRIYVSLPRSRTIRILIFPPVNRVDNARRESTRVAPSIWLTSENVKSVTIHHPLLHIFHAIQSAGWLNGFPLVSRLTTTKGTFVRGWREKEGKREGAINWRKFTLEQSLSFHWGSREFRMVLADIQGQ